MRIGYFYIYNRHNEKDYTFLLLACMHVGTMHAQLKGDGFYRIQNVKTGRYMTLADRHSRGANAHTTTVDAGALATRKEWSDIESDPGSIFYIKKVNGSEYNIISQGIDMYQHIKYYVRIDTNNNGASYKFWETDKGTRLYLSDENVSNEGADNSYVKTRGEDTRQWKIIPLNNSGSNYIGVTPLVKANNGKYYATYLTGFPYKLQSSGMKAFTISSINNEKGEATYQEITGEIPGKTPVLIECSSDKAKDNLITPLVSTSNSIKATNRLEGVFFCLGDWLSQHLIYTEFNANTMRVLGINESGELVFNNSNKYMSPVEFYDGDRDYYYIAIPHNTAYLPVTATTPSELKLVDYNTGITPIVIESDANISNDIYTINGINVRENATSVEGLPEGIYIFKNKKYVVK